MKGMGKGERTERDKESLLRGRTRANKPIAE
jgi:hypothetical protein